jgi:predicted amidophosphoribosyltransferase
VLLSALAPPLCLVCLGPAERGALCEACLGAMPWIEDPCPRCALPRCRGCRQPPSPLRAAVAPVAHAGPARDLLLALKLRRALPAADAMALQILERAPAGYLDEATLVPVPGWVPERIADALGRRARRPVVRCLTRADVPVRQVGRARGERRDARALTLAGRPPRAGPVVLIDDVHTTGTTLRSGALALRDAGFLQIAAATYVRTLTAA